jgi:signal transduction histidine kinase
MITAILLAIFIAVLSSINIILDTVMERQTKEVLQEVASSVEYDQNISDFTILRPYGDEWEKFGYFDYNEPPPKPPETAPVTTSATTTATTTSSAASASSSQTTDVTISSTETESVQTQPAETHINENVTEAPEVPAEQPVETEPAAPAIVETPATQPPTENQQKKDDDDDDDGDDDDDDDDKKKKKQQQWNSPQYPYQPYVPQEPFQPYNPWENGWGNGWGKDKDDKDKDKDDDKDKNNGQWTPWFPGCSPMSNVMEAPVLEGYTIISNSNQETTLSASTFSAERSNKKEPAPPDMPLRNDREAVPRSLGSINFFLIMADKDGKFIAMKNNDNMTEEVAQEYITQILSQDSEIGMANNYQFCTAPKANGTLLVFTDKTAEMNMMKKLKRVTLLVGSISIIALSALAYFISGQIVKPIKEAFNKQKQFISDASHELKTPLTVISANADVLAGEIGENKWLKYIQDQTERMSILVNDLLNLTRLENNSANFIQTEFDLSKAIINTALPFECQAFETNKNFVLNIDEGIKITGSEQHIKQMAAIFIDNALKYSKDGGTVRVSLTVENGKPVFSVYNTGKGVKDSEKDKIFERFYRSDASRNRATGGYGLGLAIAKSIIDKHKFKINVENEEGKSICFIVTM